MRLQTLLLFVTACVSLVSAQTESITIAPADTLQIKVLEAPDLAENVRVTDAGTVSLIVGGQVKVVGMTPAQAEKAIEAALIKGNYVLNPHVNVFVEQATVHSVSILGEVKVPGSYPIGTPRSVLDTISLAGGLTQLANRQITIERRKTGEKIPYFVPNDLKDTSSRSVLVYPGDVIIVPKAGIVYVLGDVNRPGGFPIVHNDNVLTMLQAYTLAGGTPPTAVPSHAKLIRKQKNGSYVAIPLNLSKMQKGKVADFALQADDIVYVPFSYLRNMAVNIGQLVSAVTSAAIYNY